MKMVNKQGRWQASQPTPYAEKAAVLRFSDNEDGLKMASDLLWIDKLVGLKCP